MAIAPPPSHSFTAKHTGRVRVLKTPAKICQSVTPGVAARPSPVEFTAIWDTGATNCVVTAEVVKACGLLATGMARTQGVSGVHLSKTYLVDLHLLNGVAVQGVRVTEGLLGGGANGDILIGMDIIGLGDFAVTNKDGITCFSFRVPSLVVTDYVEEHHRAQAAAPSYPRQRAATAKRPKHKKQFGKNKR